MQRLAIAAAFAALVIALLGSTSLGQAASNAAKSGLNKASSSGRLGGTAHAQRGPRGRRGPRGPRGPRGAQGPAGIATLLAVEGPAVPQCADGGGACQVAASTAVCPAGSYVVGGGFNTSTPDNVVSYARRVNTTSYGVIAVNFWVTGATLSAHAICASGAGITPQSIQYGTPIQMERKLSELRSMLANR
jgi:hypothetical protein